MTKKVTYPKTEQIQRMLEEARLWTINDVVKRLPATTMTIHNWRNQDDLPAVVIRGDERPSLRFVPEDVAAWSKQHGFNVPTDIYKLNRWPRKTEEPLPRQPLQEPKKRKPSKRIEWKRDRKPELAKLFMSLDQDVRPTYEEQAQILGCNSDIISGLRVRFGLQEHKLRNPKKRKAAVKAALQGLMQS